MRRIFMHLPDTTGCGFYRAYLPFKNCHRTLRDHDVELTCDQQLKSDADYDVVILHRLVAESFCPVVERWKEEGKKIVWEVDDLLQQIPASNPNHDRVTEQHIKRLHECFDLADMILVTTERLKEELLQWHDKVRIAPNLIDLREWPAVTPREEEIRIVWAGGETHQADLDMVNYELMAVAMTENVKFIFFGMEPSVKIPNSEYVPFTMSTQQYALTLAALKPHICIAPVVPNRFNGCKSNIKYLEYTAAGAVTVASRLEPYSCIVDGLDGMLVYPDEWCHQLRSLIANREGVQEMQAAAWEKVKNEWSWQSRKAKRKWMTLFREM